MVVLIMSSSQQDKIDIIPRVKFLTTQLQEVLNVSTFIFVHEIGTV